MATATLTVIYLMNSGNHTVQHIRSIDATLWDGAVMRGAAELRQMHRGGREIVSAILSRHNPDPEGPQLNKVFQPSEWSRS
jgi:hypothetical protein